jgi:hypothetical protein
MRRYYLNKLLGDCNVKLKTCVQDRRHVQINGTLLLILEDIGDNVSKARIFSNCPSNNMLPYFALSTRLF